MAEPSGNVESRLDTLRENGTERLAPARFAYLSALARRAADQPEAVRRLLTDKIAREADALAHMPSASPAQQTDASARSPLAELLIYIGDHGIAPSAENRPSSPDSTSVRPNPGTLTIQAPELKSVAYFRNTWSKLSTEQQLTQTLAQAPENAGPINSQHLVLRALTVMRDSAPDYLQGFMSYVDTLIWLEHASPIKPNSERSPSTEGGKKPRTTRRSSGMR